MYTADPKSMHFKCFFAQYMRKYEEIWGKLFSIFTQNKILKKFGISFFPKNYKRCGHSFNFWIREKKKTNHINNNTIVLFFNLLENINASTLAGIFFDSNC